MNGSVETFEFDPQSDDYREFSEYSTKLARLLGVPGIDKNAGLAACLDEFLGVVYALIQAKRYQFADRTDQKIDIKAVKKRANDIAQGHTRTNGKWVAGFYFNDALFRTAAVFQRAFALKEHLRRKHPQLCAILPEAKKYSELKLASLNLVCDQVNRLKHDREGTYYRRVAKYSDAVAAVRELLEFIETIAAADQQILRYARDDIDSAI